MAVFATTDSLTMHFPIKELIQLLPDDVIRKLRQHLTEDLEYITSKIRSHLQSDAPSEPSKSTGDIATSAAGIPVRQQQKGTAGLPKFQSTYCSGGMTIFFENVARGKVIPLPEDETEDKQRIGRPPEEILPSLRGEFQRKKLEEIQRKAQLDFLKPQDLSANMSKKELQAREAKIAGVSRLKFLQNRVDDLRGNDHLRSLLAQRVVGHKHDIVAKRGAYDWTLVNKKAAGDRTFDDLVKQEKRKKEDSIRDAMESRKAENEKEWEDKMKRTFLVMNRKELNDENNLQRLEEIRQRVALKRRAAVWLMTCALAARMQSWYSITQQFRQHRVQLLLWSSAVLTLQRKWREFMYTVVKEKKEAAANTILRAYRLYRYNSRRKRRYSSLFFYFILRARPVIYALSVLKFRMLHFAQPVTHEFRVWVYGVGFRVAQELITRFSGLSRPL
jgi:hypothetical protein